MTTVSRYMNGTRKINEDSACRIQAAIKELNYVPNSNARNLKRKKTYIIGLVVPDMSVYLHICKTIESLLYEENYNVIICCSNFNQFQENVQLRMLQEQRVDGIILVSNGQNQNSINSIIQSGIPVVMFDRYQSELPYIPYVLEKGNESIIELTDYILKKGHRKIAYLKGPNNSTVSEERYKTYLNYLSEHNIEFNDKYCYENVITEKDITEASYNIFDNLKDIEIVLTTNAKQLKYFIMAAHNRNISIPDDISITGFGINTYKSLFLIPITCIIQNHEEIGRLCVKKILKQQDGNSKSIVYDKEDISWIDSEFFIGQSVKSLNN